MIKETRKSKDQQFGKHGYGNIREEES